MQSFQRSTSTIQQRNQKQHLVQRTDIYPRRAAFTNPPPNQIHDVLHVTPLYSPPVTSCPRNYTQTHDTKSFTTCISQSLPANPPPISTHLKQKGEERKNLPKRTRSEYNRILTQARKNSGVQVSYSSSLVNASRRATCWTPRSQSSPPHQNATAGLRAAVTGWFVKQICTSLARGTGSTGLFRHNGISPWVQLSKGQGYSSHRLH